MFDLDPHKNIKELILDYWKVKNPLILYECRGMDYRTNSLIFSASKDGFIVLNYMELETFRSLIGFNPVPIERILEPLIQAFEKNIKVEFPPEFFITDSGKIELDHMYDLMKWELAQNFLVNKMVF